MNSPKRLIQYKISNLLGRHGFHDPSDTGRFRFVKGEMGGRRIELFVNVERIDAELGRAFAEIDFTLYDDDGKSILLESRTAD